MTPAILAISVLVTVPIDVVEGRTTVPVNVGDAFGAYVESADAALNLPLIWL